MYFDHTGLPVVLPSPNIPTFETTVVYPGGVLFEGTVLSEGRGTNKPFELIGAPWIDGERFADSLNARRLDGVFFRPAFFEPTFHKQAKQLCGGCQIHVTNRETFAPMRAAVEMLAELPRGGRAGGVWGLTPPYEYEHEKLPIDILYGSDRLRRAIDAGQDASVVTAGGARGEGAVGRVRQKVPR